MSMRSAYTRLQVAYSIAETYHLLSNTPQQPVVLARLVQLKLLSYF